MKKIDIVTVQALANGLFPDDALLGTFNILVDIMGGEMPHQLIDGAPETMAAEDTVIVGFSGVVVLSAGQGRVTWISDPSHMPQREILRSIIACLPGVPPEAEIGCTFSCPPCTGAAIVACKDGGGRFAYAIFRHPELSEQAASEILADAFQEGETPLTS